MNDNVVPAETRDSVTGTLRVSISVGDVVRHSDHNHRGRVRYIGEMLKPLTSENSSKSLRGESGPSTPPSHEESMWHTHSSNDQDEEVVVTAKTLPSYGYEKSTSSSESPLLERRRGVTDDDIWIGVEWEGQHGKHHGTLRGVQYFCCENKHGSLLRPQKLNVGKSLCDELFERYTFGGTSSSKTRYMSGSDPFFRDEATGVFKNVTHCDCSANSALSCASVAHFIPPDEMGREQTITKFEYRPRRMLLQQLFPHLSTVNVSNTLFTSWSAVLELMLCLRGTLEHFSASVNPLGCFPLGIEERDGRLWIDLTSVGGSASVVSRIARSYTELDDSTGEETSYSLHIDVEEVPAGDQDTSLLISTRTSAGQRDGLFPKLKSFNVSNTGIDPLGAYFLLSLCSRGEDDSTRLVEFVCGHNHDVGGKESSSIRGRDTSISSGDSPSKTLGGFSKGPRLPTSASDPRADWSDSSVRNAQRILRRLRWLQQGERGGAAKSRARITLFDLARATLFGCTGVGFAAMPFTNAKSLACVFLIDVERDANVSDDDKFPSVETLNLNHSGMETLFEAPLEVLNAPSDLEHGESKPPRCFFPKLKHLFLQDTPLRSWRDVSEALSPSTSGIHRKNIFTPILESITLSECFKLREQCERILQDVEGGGQEQQYLNGDELRRLVYGLLPLSLKKINKSDVSFTTKERQAALRSTCQGMYPAFCRRYEKLLAKRTQEEKVSGDGTEEAQNEVLAEVALSQLGLPSFMAKPFMAYHTDRFEQTSSTYVPKPRLNVNHYQCHILPLFLSAKQLMEARGRCFDTELTSFLDQVALRGELESDDVPTEESLHKESTPERCSAQDAMDEEIAAQQRKAQQLDCKGEEGDDDDSAGADSSPVTRTKTASPLLNTPPSPKQSKVKRANPNTMKVDVRWTNADLKRELTHHAGLPNAVPTCIGTEAVPTEEDHWAYALTAIRRAISKHTHGLCVTPEVLFTSDSVVLFHIEKEMMYNKSGAVKHGAHCKDLIRPADPLHRCVWGDGDIIVTVVIS